MTAPTLSRSPIAVGDTAVLQWNLPAGAQLLAGPKGDDSLAVLPAGPGRWILQPLSVGMHGGDTLRAVSGHDTVKECVPRFQATSHLASTQDTTAASLLPPEEVPVPFPWKFVGLGALLLAAVVLFVLWWRRCPRKAPPTPVVPPPPAIDPLDAAAQALDLLEERAAKGLTPRETAFEAGEVVRILHRALFEFSLAAESTSREWLDWADGCLGPEATGALRQFLSEADRLRYAGIEADSLPLFAAARQVLRAAARERKAS